ncbi:hypothetical protein J5J10_20705 [Ciceribacter sp. L1K23]|uniref:hypothetical protein n=1 Tax=Ciceribacter sp. L1K23 TaxID=2820276 RepID=UPI001B83D209|nr:hypothetical protein [Ciceribacter sp. L1K23]MBR0558120.1 hypothetical protein [Ciceribacter sp. L1K23]
MGLRGVVALSSISGAGLAAVVTLPFLSQRQDWPDDFVSASIPPQLAAGLASPPARFSVTNLSDMTVCLVDRGGALTSRSRSFEAGQDCGAVWPGLVQAANWIENGDGTVTLSNGNGEVVLTLGRGHGFSYESLDTDGASLAWLLLP